MLEGREISVLMLSEVLNTNKYFRIDDEFFSQKFISIDKILSNTNVLLLKDISYQITDFGAYSQTNILNFVDDGILFLRNQEIKSNFIDLDNAIFIEKEIYDRITLHLKENDIVIPRVGTLGKAALIEKKHLPCSANQNLAVIRTETINHRYLTTFLNCHYGTSQIFRTSTGNVQQWLNLENISNLKIFVPSQAFQTEIENLVKQAHTFLDQSKTLYTEAENLLLESLGLTKEGFASSETFLNANIKTFSSSFLSTGRLDAEYYQPKYEILENKIKSYEGGFCRLKDLVSIKKSIETGSDAYSDNGIPYVRVSNITKYGISMPDIHISNEYYQKNKTLLDNLKLKKDTILLSKDGSIGIAYKVSEDLEMLTSGALLHLTIKNQNKFLPDCLALILNSEIVQKQAERDSGGSIIVHWRVSEIENVLIPLLDIETQTLISSKIQESFRLKSENEALLSLAKSKVEEAIERGIEK